MKPTGLKVRELAEQYLKLFTQSTREDGTEYYHTTVTNEREHPLAELCMAAHEAGDMLPDDWRYRFIHDALCDFAEGLGRDDINGIESDIYTADLTAWLASRNDRYSYCDQYADEIGMPTEGRGGLGSNFLTLLSGGQWMEKTEVYQSVLSSLESIIEAMDEEDASEDTEEEEAE